MFIERNEIARSKDLNRNLELELEHVCKFGKVGQALIGGYDLRVLEKLVEHKAFDNKGDFQYSKPQVDKKQIKICSYRTHFKSNPRYECVWYKFKSPEVIDGVMELHKTGKEADLKVLQALAFHEARKMVPDAAKILDEKGYKFSFDSKNMQTGFSWINSDITFEKTGNNIYINTPTLITNKFVPVFGGMSYCKVFTPNDAAKILVDLASEMSKGRGV